MLFKRCFRVFSQKFTNYNRIAGLSEELQEYQAQVNEFCRKEVEPLANEVDQKDWFPRELWPKMGEFGLLGVTCPEEFGGLGLGYTAQCIAMEEISRYSGSIGLSYGAHSNLCLNQIARYGTQSQKEQYLPKLSNGEFIGALAMSETGAGSDVVSMKTTAIEKDDHFILNGNKMWITNGPYADVIVVYAKTGKKEITAFLIDKEAEGFSVAQKLDKLGMRGSPTGELVFENVKVSKDKVLGEIHKGVYVLMSGLDYERLVLSAGPLGIMQASLDTTIDYVTQRKQFGKHIGEFQLMQGKIADMYVKLQSTRTFLYSLAKLADEGIIDNNECAALIYMASENSVQVALEAIQALGGNGYINEYPTGRYLRDAKLYTIGAGTNEIRRWLIGRSLVKEFTQN